MKVKIGKVVKKNKLDNWKRKHSQKDNEEPDGIRFLEKAGEYERK